MLRAALNLMVHEGDMSGPALFVAGLVAMILLMARVVGVCP